MPNQMMSGHGNDVVKFHNRGEFSETFSINFTKNLKKKSDAISAKNVREILKVRVIKEFNPTLISKKLGVMNANYTWKKG